MEEKMTLGLLLDTVLPSTKVKITFANTSESIEGKAIEIAAAIEARNYRIFNLKISYISVGNRLIHIFLA